MNRYYTLEFVRTFRSGSKTTYTLYGLGGEVLRCLAKALRKAGHTRIRAFLEPVEGRTVIAAGRPLPISEIGWLANRKTGDYEYKHEVPKDRRKEFRAVRDT